MNSFDNSTKHRDDISFGGKMADSEQSLQLLEANNNGCTSHEPNYGSMREKIDQKSQPERR